MQVRRCTNTQCLRPYRIRKSESAANEFQSGKLNCPHCDHVEALWEGDAFSLHALTAEQEADFDFQDPRNSSSDGRPTFAGAPVMMRTTFARMLLSKPFFQTRFLQTRKSH